MSAGTGGGMGDAQPVAATISIMTAVSSNAGPAFTGCKGSISVIELYVLMDGDVHSAGAASFIKRINYGCTVLPALILSLVKE